MTENETQSLLPVPAETSEREKTANAPKVSVIVPVYKVEKYVAECIESILAQTFTDFELILVDDGSPDNSGKICDAYAQKDSRIRVFHKPNGGVTSARRLGVEQAKGEWIMFVDSDDKVFPNCLSALLAVATPDVDLVEGLSTRDPAQNNGNGETVCFFSGADSYVSEIASYKEQLWYVSPWAKIIRHDLLLETGALDIPADITFGEDFLMLVKIAQKLRKAIRISNLVYFYRRNPEGACAVRARSAKHWLKFLKTAEEILREKWFVAWIELSRRYFVTMFLTSPDFDPKDNYTKTLCLELWNERKRFSLGTKLCLLFTRRCPGAHQQYVRGILNQCLKIKLRCKR